MEKIKEKTNAIRALEQKKIAFKFHDYSSSGAISGVVDLSNVFRYFSNFF